MTLASFCQSTTQTQVPGPGSYEEEKIKKIGSNYSVHCAIRPRYTKKNQNSGVTYKSFETAEFTSSLSRQGYTIAHRSFDTPITPSLGPSFLPDSNDNFRKYVSIKSRYYRKKEEPQNPGPGQYTPQDLPKTQIPTMGGRPPIILDAISDSPGPAAYTIPETIGSDSHSFTIQQKHEPPTDPEPIPGYKWNEPGQLGSSAPRYSISRAERSRQFEGVDTPGPGSYEPLRPASQLGPYIHERMAEKPSLTAAVPLVNVRMYPEIKPRAISPKCGRGYLGAINNVPGPNFLPQSTLETKGVTLPRKKENDEKSAQQAQTGPGPSDYNPYSGAAVEVKRFSFKGPETKMDWIKATESPGPGQYDIKVPNRLPMWSIGVHESLRRSSSSQKSKRPMSQVSKRPASQGIRRSDRAASPEDKSGQK